jgi:hypothetical protein
MSAEIVPGALESDISQEICHNSLNCFKAKVCTIVDISFSFNNVVGFMSASRKAALITLWLRGPPIIILLNLENFIKLRKLRCQMVLASLLRRSFVYFEEWVAR